jgi:glycosyltransferase involved in cell wall biosynthesis
MATYNQLPAMRRAVRGYLRQTTNEFVLTIADDGSRPDTADLVRSFAAEAASRGLRVDHVWQEDLGYRRAAVLNEGVRRSEGEPLLIFTDADCIPPATFVERHLARHEPFSFHVGGVVMLSEQASAGLTEDDVDAGRHEALATLADRWDLAWRAWKSRVGLLLHRPRRPKVFGANLALDRGLFEALNGFDERFDSYGFEDSDLRDRAVRLRPSTRMKVLHGRNDVFHLWHPRAPGRREAVRAYYDRERPVRCERGLLRPAASA